MAKDSVQNVQQGVADFQKEGLSETTRRDFGRAVPVVGPALAQAQAQHDAGNDAGMAGTLAGTVAGLAAPEALKGIKPAAVSAAVKAAPGAVVDTAANAVRATGEASEALGNKLMNETVGSYRKDFNRNANPGRGYNEAVGGPSLTVRSAANKAAAVKTETGQAIGKIIKESGQSGALIPIDKVIEAVSKPLREQYDLEMGEGGLGNIEPYEKYAARFNKTLTEGAQKGGLTTQEVFDLKQRIAKRAKWNNTTPEGIMDVRQQQVGALGGLLKDAIPQLGDLSRNYQDLVGLADRLQWRADSGALPFRKIVHEGSKMAAGGAAALHGGTLEGLGAYGLLSAADSFAGRSTAATGLFKAGQGLTSIADRIQRLRAQAAPAIEESVSQPVQGQAVTSTPQNIRITKVKRLVP
jgi:hypothetical protein